ncbi:uncharacterized protein [Oryza sativa Japonica Group]|uniref:Os08g0420700 protein n=3 Tax=Oryza sativa TaxID=4530 RepID=A3BT76_ORYSJ|nr:uncharacterized protein LOC4345590 [Oryza sativa Japonica Group]EAZ07026.1 hypothetical protein OsI_29274 [Oryza sativa Indica Group]EAZ42765.1 hypothetical protein OsJ_27345 [Oryza sativa Japonica Group]BAC24949.1 hypothetical protein [Oryza sativa Japonica Group]BAC99452.1 hypothetical protein [Oryza sativa Japonica Group]BAF23733.1 Os08g0420700 [Oryza sativa Japonica Group]|eukprot:NP_001061819.1 Os08g0420700 [Oryza sativa Japonica Group]
MGNCQAAEVAAVVIQHPGGKVERLYWPATAADVMRSNPGHYVALVLLRVSASSSGGGGGGKAEHSAVGAAVGDESGGAAAKITKIKLLKPKETLLLGKVYRLVTSQEVTKALQARRQEKMRRCKEVTDHHHRQPQTGDSAAAGEEQRRPSDHQERKPAEKDRHRSSGGGGGGRGRNWRPSLQSISESAS